MRPARARSRLRAAAHARSSALASVLDAALRSDRLTAGLDTSADAETTR